MGEDEETRAPGRARRSRRAGQPDRTSVEGDAASAFAEYARALREGWMSDDLPAGVRGAYGAYVRRLGEAWAPQQAGERSARALLGYTRMVGGLIDPERDNAEVYRDYMRELSEVWGSPEAPDSESDARREYLKAVAQALEPDELERRVRDAYGAYLDSVKDLCGRLDPGTTEPDALAALGHSITAAAAAASASRHAIEQRRAARTGLTITHGI